MKSAAAALGPAASYLCTPEAHGNAPTPSEGDAGRCDGRGGGEQAEGQGQGGLRGKTRGER